MSFFFSFFSACARRPMYRCRHTCRCTRGSARHGLCLCPLLCVDISVAAPDYVQSWCLLCLAPTRGGLACADPHSLFNCSPSHRLSTSPTPIHPPQTQLLTLSPLYFPYPTPQTAIMREIVRIRPSLESSAWRNLAPRSAFRDNTRLQTRQLTAILCYRFTFRPVNAYVFAPCKSRRRGF